MDRWSAKVTANVPRYFLDEGLVLLSREVLIDGQRVIATKSAVNFVPIQVFARILSAQRRGFDPQSVVGVKEYQVNIFEPSEHLSEIVVALGGTICK